VIRFLSVGVKNTGAKNVELQVKKYVRYTRTGSVEKNTAISGSANKDHQQFSNQQRGISPRRCSIAAISGRMSDLR